MVHNSWKQKNIKISLLNIDIFSPNLCKKTSSERLIKVYELLVNLKFILCSYKYIYNVFRGTQGPLHEPRPSTLDQTNKQTNIHDKWIKDHYYTRLPFLNRVILTLSAASSASAYEWIEKMPQTLNQSTKYLVQTVVRI